MFCQSLSGTTPHTYTYIHVNAEKWIRKNNRIKKVHRTNFIEKDRFFSCSCATLYGNIICPFYGATSNFRYILSSFAIKEVLKLLLRHKVHIRRRYTRLGEKFNVYGKKNIWIIFSIIHISIFI